VDQAIDLEQVFYEQVVILQADEIEHLDQEVGYGYHEAAL